MTDGAPMSIPTASIPQPSATLASRHDDQSRPHAHQSLLHHASSHQAALLSNQNAAAANKSVNLAFPPLDTTRRILDAFNSPDPSPSTSDSPLVRGETFGAAGSGNLEFRSRTIAPSPCDSPSPPRSQSLSHHAPDESPRYQRSPLAAGSRSGSVARPHIDPSAAAAARSRRDSAGNAASSLSPTTPVRTSTFGLTHKTSASSLRPPSRTPSFKTSLGPTFGTASAASSTFPSPIIAAMGDLTPLPSPLLAGDSPGPWKRLGRPPSRDAASPTLGSDAVLVSTNGESISAALANQSKRKAYAGLGLEGDASGSSSGGLGAGSEAKPSASTTASYQVHTRNRSVSEYTPDPMLIPKRMLTVTGSRGSAKAAADDAPHLRREPHLSAARGLTPAEKPPTPPPSESSLSAGESSSTSSTPAAGGRSSSSTPRGHRYEYFEAHNRRDGKLRRWRAVKMLGQGTFSRVMLATSAPPEADEESEGGGDIGDDSAHAQPEQPYQKYDRKTLVAVKVCEHGPKGGASEERVEMSLKRELEIMQSISHPSLVHLRAWSIEPTRAILVLSYCPGGDLFDVATAHRKLLTPALMRRIFAELVGAVQYLHERRIVHRDIKLENVLVNLPPDELADPAIDWTTYPHPVATLTDLGLSRRVADDEKLETRCGSDDYAAPEVIMGQPYDGRAIDAWSLGVLLYALLESRLPFDPLPGTVNGADSAHRMRSRTSHRIARVEWRWVAFAGDDGDHEGDEALFKSKGLLGAMEITEGLLKRARSRWSVEKVAGCEWVRDALQVEGGVRFRDEDEGGDAL